MKGNSEVVLLKNWGLAKMAATEREEALEEIGHAEQLIERILYLEGTPKMEGGKPSQVSADVREVLQHNLALEVAGIADLRDGIAAAERGKDAVSRELMVRILADEEHHEDHLATQLELIDKIGLENYIAAQL
jgi:bacterioferritin